MESIRIVRKDVSRLLKVLIYVRYIVLMKSLCMCPRSSVETLERLLEMLINKSVGEGVVPKEWRRADVLIFEKKNDRIIALNYRPASLTRLV